jgi:hypothetical protein
MVRFRAFDVRFMPPTNTLGSRIRIRDLRREGKVIIPYNHAIGNVLEQGEAYLNSIGINPDVLLLADKLDCYIIGSKNFETPLT